MSGLIIVLIPVAIGVRITNEEQAKASYTEKYRDSLESNYREYLETLIEGKPYTNKEVGLYFEKYSNV